MITKYKSFLSRQDLAANTVRSYVWTVTHFLEKYKEVTRENLLAYKGYLVEHHKPQTVNLRLQAINKYLEFIKKEKLKMRFVGETGACWDSMGGIKQCQDLHFRAGRQD